MTFQPGRPRRRLTLARLCLALVAAVGVLATPGALRAAPAEQANPVTLTARAGFDGYYKEARWVPLRLTVANDGPDTRGTLVVKAPRTSSGEITITREIELPTQSRREIWLYVPLEAYTRNVRIQLLNGRTVLAQRDVGLNQAGANDLVYGVVANAASVYNLLANINPANGSAYVAELELGDLPPATAAWQSLDVVVLSDVDTGALTPEQRTALAGWVAAGGRLIVAGGPGWQKTAAGLAGLLPVAPTGTSSVASLSALAEFTSSPAPLGATVVAAGQLSPDAVTLVSAADIPLIVSRREGYGQITYLAADPSFAPLRDWGGLPALFRNVLTSASPRPMWAGGVRNWYQGREAVNALPGLGFPSWLLVCGFLGAYLLAIGPINYFFLRRARRRELGWLTIPAIVLAFSAGAYLTGYQFRGTTPVLHRLAVVLVWPDSDQARVEQVVGLFSPRRADFDLEFAEGFLVRPLPDPGLGGAAGGNYRVEQGDRSVVQRVRLDVGQLSPFMAQGTLPAPQFESALVLEVTRSTATLRGDVTNRSGLRLEDAVVLGPGSAARLGRLGPGETASVVLPLQNAQAVPAADPIAPLSGGGPSGPMYGGPYYGPGATDTTIDDILGGGNYWGDRQRYRRYALLASMIENYGTSTRGNNVYLVGWVQQAPVDVTLGGAEFEANDETLYVVELRPELSASAGVISIPPGLMTWTALDPANPSGAPYGLNLYQGSEVGLRFFPTQLLTFSRVQDLVLHLESYGASGSTQANVDLWNFTSEAWDRQALAVGWGDNSVPEPARYVGPGGEIRVRLTAAGQPNVSIERLDFTLTVER